MKLNEYILRKYQKQIESLYYKKKNIYKGK